MVETRERTFTPIAQLIGSGVLVSLLPMVYLHLAASGKVDPIAATISDYIFVEHGAALLAMASLTLAGTSVALLLALRARGLPARGPEASLLWLWSAGLVVVALFPTDPTGAPLSLSGALHRYAAVAMFASLPLAGWLLSRRFPGGALLRGLSVVAGLAAVAFMVSHVSVGGQPDGTGLLGLSERVLFLLLCALLLALASAADRWKVPS